MSNMDLDADDEHDRDSDNDMDNEVDLTGFLFGNIDSSGQLVDDIFDNESKKQLGSLARLGLNNLLSEVIREDGQARSKENDANGIKDDSDKETEEDYEKKSDTAVDYSDINELAEDVQSTMPPPAESAGGDDYDETENDASKKPDETKTDTETESEDKTKEGKTNEVLPSKDKELMPPPSVPPKSQLNYDLNKADGVNSAANSDEEASVSSAVASILPNKTNGEKKLETPLAAMLPSKYANVDVRELFPDFRPDKVLRFSRLFGPGKPSSLPQIWRSVRKRRGRRKMSREGSARRDGSDSTSESDDLSERKVKGFSVAYGAEPSKEQIVSDDEDRLLSEVSDKAKEKAIENNDSGDQKQKIADWRFGPAQVWYDMLEVAESGEGFNYGFKLRDKNDEDAVEIKGEPIPDDAYLMVSQLHWEDDVVWDGNDIKHKVMQKLNSKTNAAGWLPSSGSRTAGAFSQPGKGMPSTPIVSGPGGGKSAKMSKAQMLLQKQEEIDDTWYSIFPVENEELVYSKWEDEVIWDAEAMVRIPKPKVLTLDPNDENIILGIPDDIDPSKVIKNTRPPPKVKIPHPHVKKSKILLGKAGVINVLAEDTPPPPPKSPDRDPFNISNDLFYMAKSSENTMRMKVGGGNLIQHSTPVVELRAPFVPTHMGPMKLRAFHRPAAKKYSHGAIAGTDPHSVHPLAKHIKKKSRQRELERIASGGGDVFFMRNPEDLSGKDGEIVLVEFCEEHPPLMNQVGMCSKIKNYYKRKAAKDAGPPEFRYGEIAYAHTSPFLGILQQGHCIQTVENNMYRTPIYEHNVAPSDFLLIRTRNSYFVREIDALFTAGQECPLYEVPGPNSKRANNFVRDFLQVFIYRLFWKSRDMPRRIRMDDIKRAFPGHSESSIRKRLKQCADFKRTGMDSNWWVIKPEFRLPSEEEIRAMVSPEQCCAYFSMIAAEQRLKDAGYGEKFLFAPQDDDDEEMQLKMDDEVKVAPWNTTRAYIQAMRGKCLLQLTGPADPTGCGEGFSYVRIPNKPTQSKEEQESQPKRTVTGTDADLRRLSLNNAKALLRKFQVPEEEIKKLSRWEVIDVVRTLSTEKAKAGEEGMDKFSRGNRFSIAEHQERYKEECQRIFDLQNRVLASAEVLSTDEGESTASEESDLEELGKNLENMLANKKTSIQLSLEREEQERQELLKKIMEEREGAPKGSKKKDDDSIPSHLQPGRILKITRTFKNPEGKEYTRVEIVRRPQVIDAYVKIRSTKDENFIRQFATLDEAQKEEMKREKRRIQEQLRRIKRNQEKVGQSTSSQFMTPGGQPIQTLGDPQHSTSSKSSSHTNSGTPHTPTNSSTKDVSPSRRKVKLKPDLKLKCGACQQVGHMRTNKACPLYTGSQLPNTSMSVAITEEQEEEIEKEMNNCDDEEDLVNVDGTKMKLSGKLLKRHEDVRRRTLLLKVPKDAVRNKRRRVASDIHCDYLKKHNKTTNRRRTDPVVVLLSILEQILNELRDMPDVQPFLFPVNGKLVPDYYNIVVRPMDLQSIRENLRQRKYQNREEFLADINQIRENSIVYNGLNSSLTAAAERMLKKCGERLDEKEERLIRLEKAINPLLDDNDQVSLSFIFENLVNATLKTMPESWPFLKPVNKKQVKDYYTVIRRPMDLETISKKIAAHKYHSRAELVADIELIANNCEQYNGNDSNFTQQARLMVSMAKDTLAQFSEAQCESLERNIAAVQQRHHDDDDDDAWMEDEQDREDVQRMRLSRNSSPDNDFVDVEGTERPMSAASGSSQHHRVGPSIIPALPEIKRGRGRPRKNRDNLEDAKVWRMKRGRGRPRKDSQYSINSYTHNSYLEEDLQFSTDDEEFEEVAGEFETTTASVLGQGEGLARSAQPVNYAPGGQGADGSQQAAEAMVQLASVGFYGQPDESMDVDPNYDPSDFLKLASSIKVERPDPDQMDPMELAAEQQDTFDEAHHSHQLMYDEQQMHSTHPLKNEMPSMELQTSTGDHQQYDNNEQIIYPDGSEIVDAETMQQQQQQQQQQQPYIISLYEDQQYAQSQEMMNATPAADNHSMYHHASAEATQQQQPDEGMGVGIDDDLAVSDSEDEDVLNAGDPPQQFDATEPAPAPPVVVETKHEPQLDIEPDDDGGDLWF